MPRALDSYVSLPGGDRLASDFHQHSTHHD